MADIPQPYRPYDLFRSGLDAAGEGVNQWQDEQLRKQKQAELDAPEHPSVVAFIQQQLHAAGVPPDKIEAATNQVVTQFKKTGAVTNQMVPGPQEPPVSMGGQRPPADPSMMRTSPGMSPAQTQLESGVRATQAATPDMETGMQGLFPQVTRPSNIQTAGGLAAGQAQGIMGAGLQRTQIQAGPAQQALGNPVAPAPAQGTPQMFTAPQPQQAPTGPQKQWTKSDTARMSGILPAAVAANSREEVARTQAEAKQKVAMKRDETMRALAAFRASNSNGQLAAKLESAAAIAMARGDIQSQNNFYDFTADLLRIEQMANKIEETVRMKQGDWEMKAAQLMANMANADKAAASRIAGSLNFMDPMQRQAMEDALSAGRDKADSAARMMDAIGAKRSAPDLVRPPGATDSKGNVLQQGGEETPAPTKTSAPEPTPVTPPAKPPEEPKKPKKPKLKGTKTVTEAPKVTPQANKLLGLMGKGS